MFSNSKSSTSKYSLLGTTASASTSSNNNGKLERSSSTSTELTTNTDTLNQKKKDLTFLELLRVLRPYFWPNEGSESAFSNRVRAISTWVTVLLSKACNLAAPYCIAAAADILINGDFYGSIKYIVAYILLRIGSTFFKELQSIIYVKVKQQASIELQELTFRHLHTLSLNWHVSKNTGSVVKSMDRGIDAVGNLVTWVFLSLGPALMECFAVMLLFFFQFSQWGLGLTVFIGVSVYILVTVLITQWRKKFREATNKQDNDFHDKATDSIINFETVKYFTAEDFETKRFKESVVKYQVFSSSTSISGSFLNIAQQVILWSSMLAALLISGRAVVNGTMTVGGWIAVQSWVTSIFAPLNWLGSLYSAVVQALIDIRSLNELLTEEPDITDESDAVDIPIAHSYINKYKQYDNDGNIVIPFTTTATDIDFSESDGIELLNQGSSSGITKNKKTYFPRFGKTNSKNKHNHHHDSDNNDFSIVADDEDNDNTPTGGGGVSVDFENIYFHYPSQNPERGLKDVSIHIKAGSTTAIVGHTGAGKTTISRLLFRFYDPLQGRVSIGGHDIKKYTQKSVRASIGIVPQDCVLFNDTILHNIKYGRLDATFEEVEAAAAAAHIKTFIESLTDGWDTKVGERGLKLSGGEKQRVAIARCLLKDPPVVLLDEATSALDTMTEASIQEALSALGSERTVIVIAHRLSTIKNADQIVVLDNGSVAEKGTHQELMELNQIYAKLWSMQIKSVTNSLTLSSSQQNMNKLTNNSSNNLNSIQNKPTASGEHNNNNNNRHT